MHDVLTARHFLSCIATAAASLLAVGCIPATDPAPAVVAPTPTPTPAPPPPIISEPTYANFLDAPQTIGEWRYVHGGNGSRAEFTVAGRTVEFALRCDRAARRVALSRSATATSEVPMRIRTETGERLVSAGPDSAGRSLTAQLAARDPLLDAIAFSRGRFAVETAGLRTLYLPSWPEITRVIEDCR